MIDLLHGGMTWAQVFTILNQVIAAVNQIQQAVGNAFVEGTIDYTALANKPSIEGHTLVGNSSKQDIDIEDPTPFEQRLNTLQATTGQLQSSLQTVSNSLSSVETVVGDINSGMKKDVNDMKNEIGNTGADESITKDLDMTRKFCNAVVDIAIAYSDKEELSKAQEFVNTLAEKTKFIVKK